MGVALRQGGVLVLEEDVAVVIGHPLRGAENGFDDLVVQYLAVGVHGHDAGEGQPVHVGVEGADAVGELLRQHGDHPVGKVHRGGAVECLQVQGGIFGHIVGHVGDVDAQDPVSLPVLLQADGVVKVLGGGAVDGDDGFVPQVQPAGAGGGVHLLGGQLGGGGHRSGEVGIDAVLVEEGGHSGLPGALPAEGALEGAHGGQLGAAVAGDGHGDLVPRLQFGRRSAHNLHGVGIAVAGGLEPHLPAPALHGAHQGAVGPLHHSGDFGQLPLRVLGVGLHPGGDPVPRPGAAVAAGRHKEVGLPAHGPFRREEAKATGGGLIGSL